MKSETILIDALKKAVQVIKQWHQADDVWDIYYNKSPEMKPIREALASAPESGGEEKEMAIAFDKWKRDNRYIWDFWDNDTEKYYAAWDDYKSYTTEQLYDIFLKDFVPSIQSSDVTPVASHTSTSSNSIEQGLKRPIRAIRYACDFFKVKNLNEFLEKYPKAVDQWLFNELSKAHEKGAEDFVNSNSEQEDKRSVATKSNQGGDAGDKKENYWQKPFPKIKPDGNPDCSLSKEEGKDEGLEQEVEELVKATLIVGARRANDSLNSDSANELIKQNINGLTKRFLSVVVGQDTELATEVANLANKLVDSQQEVERLKGLLEKVIELFECTIKFCEDMGLDVKSTKDNWQQFAKENGLKGEQTK